MGTLGFNKFFGAALATFLLIMGLNELATNVFGGGGHHGESEYSSQNEWAEAKFHGYRIDIAEVTSGADGGEGAGFDLGFALANADPAAGEIVLNRQCATCHSWNKGGANGTGPNLYGIIGRDIASASGFSYSSALSGLEGEWTYDNINAWLTNPGSFARGTSMAYAGLRSPRRDGDRSNLIAYLASASPGAPEFPAALETAPEGDAEGEAATEATETGDQTITEETVENAQGAATVGASDAGEVPTDTAEDAGQTPEDAATEE